MTPPPIPVPPEVAQSCPVGCPSLLLNYWTSHHLWGKVTAPTVRVTRAGVCLDGRGLFRLVPYLPSLGWRLRNTCQ